MTLCIVLLFFVLESAFWPSHNRDARRGEARWNRMGWDVELLLPALQSLSFLLSSSNVFRVIRVLASSSRYLPLSVLPCFRF